MSPSSVVNMRISHPPPPITRRSCQSKIRLGLIMELSRLEQKLNCVAVFSQTEMPHLISRSYFYSSMQLLNEKLKPQQCAKLVALRRNSNGTKLHQSWVASIVNSKVASIVNSQDASIDSKWNPELMLLHPCHHPAGHLTCIAATVMQCNSQWHHLTCMQCNCNL